MQDWQSQTIHPPQMGLFTFYRLQDQDQGKPYNQSKQHNSSSKSPSKLSMHSSNFMRARALTLNDTEYKNNSKVKKSTNKRTISQSQNQNGQHNKKLINLKNKKVKIYQTLKNERRDTYGDDKFEDCYSPRPKQFQFQQYRKQIIIKMDKRPQHKKHTEVHLPKCAQVNKNSHNNHSKIETKPSSIRYNSNKKSMRGPIDLKEPNSEQSSNFIMFSSKQYQMLADRKQFPLVAILKKYSHKF